MKTSKLLLVSVALGFASGLSAQTAPDRDRYIEDAVKSSYNFRKVIDRSVDVKVSNGVATLTGIVPTEEQRRVAEDTVLNIKGVARVDNRLRVSGEREGSDEWIALKIRGRLAVRPSVSMVNTNVDVKDGVVTLTGLADSVAQKELTGAYVKEIAGVRSVENKLHVTQPTGRVSETTPTAPNAVPRRDENRETLGEKVDDASITAQIKYELFAHKSTSALKTKIDTDGGRVVITGEAQSEAERDVVTTLAKNVRGVLSVDNRMTVKGR